MARDTPVRKCDESSSTGGPSDDGERVLERRTYLKAIGTTAAALGALGGAGATAAASGDVIEIDYDAFSDPSDVYDVNDLRGSHTPEFVTDRATVGDHSLYTEFTDAQKTANIEYRFPDHVGDYQDEVYTRFQIYPGNFSLGADDTVRIFWAPLTNGTGSSGGGATDGTNGWSNAIGFANRNNSPAPDGYKFFSYCYHMDNSGSGDFQMTDAVVRMDEWNEVECYVKVNTYSGGSANSDGIMRYWVNGELAFEDTSMRFTTSDDNRIEAVGPLGYVVGSGAGELYYDEHAICLGMGRDEARAALDDGGSSAGGDEDDGAESGDDGTGEDDTDDGSETDGEDQPTADHDVELAATVDDVQAGEPVGVELTFTSDDDEVYEGTMTVSVGDQSYEGDWFVGSEHIYSPEHKGDDFSFDLEEGEHEWEVVAAVGDAADELTESGTVQVGAPDDGGDETDDGSEESDGGEETDDGESSDGGEDADEEEGSNDEESSDEDESTEEDDGSSGGRRGDSGVYELDEWLEMVQSG